MASRVAGARCQTTSKISSGRVSVPAVSILNFSSRCGSGVIGATAMKRAAATRIPIGMVSIHFMADDLGAGKRPDKARGENNGAVQNKKDPYRRGLRRVVI